MLHISYPKALNNWKSKCCGMIIEFKTTCLYTLQFADDQGLRANDKEDIGYMLRKLMEKYQKWELKINVQKTEYLCVGSDSGNLTIENNKEIAACSEYRLATLWNTR